MKKSRLGERTSHRKQRGTMMGLDDDHNAAPPRRPDAPKPPRARRTSAQRGGCLKAAILVIVLAAVAAAAAMLFSSGSPFTLKVDTVQLRLGETPARIVPGDTLEVSYGSGLICERITYSGWHRLFPPSSTVFSIEGVEGSANRFNENLVALLEPENRLEYRFTVTGKDLQELAAFSITLTMTAVDWINRSDQVADPAVRVSCLEKAIALNPDSLDAHVALGRLYESRKNRGKAAREYEAVLKIDANHAAALKSLINLYEGNRKKTTRLIQLYERLAMVEKAGADSLYFKAGELARTAGKTQTAMQLYRKALAKNRGHIPARQQLVKIYESRKEWNRAAGNTVVLLEYEPKNADLHLFLSQMYLNMKKYTEALREATQAARLRPASAEISLHQAMLAEKAGKKKEAVKYYKQALELDSKNHIICNNLAILLEKQGKRKEAITYYKKAVALNPSNNSYRANLADAYEKSGQLKQAAAAYAALVKRDKKNKKAWEALAVLRERTKDPAKALKAYEALNRLEPKKILWLQKMGELHEQLGSLAKARDAYKAVLDINPKHSRARRKYVELSKKLVLQ